MKKAICVILKRAKKGTKNRLVIAGVKWIKGIDGKKGTGNLGCDGHIPDLVVMVIM